jgi:hypothetical protein
LPLNPELEHAALCGLIDSEIQLSKLHPDELSLEGKMVYKAVRELTKDKSPATFKAVYLHATEVLGADPEDFRVFLKQVEQGEVANVDSILDVLARKTIMNEIVNEATTQIAEGSYSLLAMKGIVERHVCDKNILKPLSEEMVNVTPPVGMTLPGLESFNREVGGLFGLWVVSGMPAAGKSTLALMIGLLTSALHRPVLYYDFEQGKSVMRWHAHKALKGDKKAVHEHTKRLYVRHNISLLERDLEMIDEPCLVVVDSIQKVASGTTYRRETLETWVHKLEGLKQFGHHVIVVSEKNRAHYNEASMSGYKESGEIEYAADAAFDLLLPDPNNSSVVDVHIVKNRHHKFHGHLTTLNRVNSFWFKDRCQRNTAEVD